MITLNQRNRLTRAINRFTRANVEHSWKGGGDPSDIPEIERRLELAKAYLDKVLDEVTEAEHHHREKLETGE